MHNKKKTDLDYKTLLIVELLCSLKYEEIFEEGQSLLFPNFCSNKITIYIKENNLIYLFL